MDNGVQVLWSDRSNKTFHTSEFVFEIDIVFFHFFDHSTNHTIESVTAANCIFQFGLLKSACINTTSVSYGMNELPI